MLWLALVRAGFPLALASPLQAALGASLGLLAADLASGLVHWLCDSFGSPETPLLGPLLIAGFRDHHARPEEIIGHGPVDLLGTTALALLPVLAGGIVAVPSWEGGRGALAWGLLVAFTAGSAATNGIHFLAHRSKAAPRPVAWLQRCGLILSPEAHARHHAAPHDRAYCITTGWCNPLLDRTRILPRVAARLGGSRGT